MCDAYFSLFWGNFAAKYKIELPRRIILVEHLSTDVKIKWKTRWKTEGGRNIKGNLNSNMPQDSVCVHTSDAWCETFCCQQ